ncbi:MAG: sulfite exporter TauE/SafE family protein [Dermatophilaceae bacterium]|nr:sulfite exporter TauE/SafE family protein [Intrasporangiaceae bacterium]
MLWLTLALAVVVGVALGLFGGGGSILTVPLLIYVTGLDTKEAIATSLVVVGATAIGALVTHARARRVEWRTGLIFGSTAMVGAYAGGLVGPKVPDLVLLVGFALMMLATAVAMIRGRKAQPPSEERKQSPVLLILVEGVIVGLVTGIVGAGGGFLVVPALVLLGGLPMATAVGTSLLVIALKSFAALAGYLTAVQIDWGLAASVTALALVGSVLGGWLAGRIDPDRLRKSFGIFVLGMAIFVLVQTGLSA